MAAAFFQLPKVAQLAAGCQRVCECCFFCVRTALDSKKKNWLVRKRMRNPFAFGSASVIFWKFKIYSDPNVNYRSHKCQSAKSIKRLVGKKKKRRGARQLEIVQFIWHFAQVMQMRLCLKTSSVTFSNQYALNALFLF